MLRHGVEGVAPLTEASAAAAAECDAASKMDGGGWWWIEMMRRGVGESSHEGIARRRKEGRATNKPIVARVGLGTGIVFHGVVQKSLLIGPRPTGP